MPMMVSKDRSCFHDILDEIRVFFNDYPAQRNKFKWVLWQRFARELLPDRMRYTSKEVTFKQKLDALEYNYYDLNVYYFLKESEKKKK